MITLRLTSYRKGPRWLYEIQGTPFSLLHATSILNYVREKWQPF